MSRNSTGYTGQLEPRRREFLSLVATLLSQETHDILLQTLNLFQLAIAICENILQKTTAALTNWFEPPFLFVINPRTSGLKGNARLYREAELQ